LRREEVGVYVRNRLERGNGTGKRTGGCERAKVKRMKGEKKQRGDGGGYYKKREGRQEAKACSIGRYRVMVDVTVKGKGSVYELASPLTPAFFSPWHGRCPPNPIPLYHFFFLSFDSLLMVQITTCPHGRGLDPLRKHPQHASSSWLARGRVGFTPTTLSLS
jgi:hypothetical protein